MTLIANSKDTTTIDLQASSTEKALKRNLEADQLREGKARLKVKEGILSSHEDLRKLETKSDYDNKNIDELWYSKDRLNSSPEFSISDNDIGLDDISSAIYYMISLSSGRKVKLEIFCL